MHLGLHQPWLTPHVTGASCWKIMPNTSKFDGDTDQIQKDLFE
jgi:hypothetical protein